MCSSLFKVSPKQMQLRMEIDGQITSATSATAAIQMSKWCSQSKFFSKFLNYQLPNLYDCFLVPST